MSDRDSVHRKAVGILILLTLLLTMAVVACDDPEPVVTAPTQLPTSTPTAAATPIVEDASASPVTTVPTPAQTRTTVPAATPAPTAMPAAVPEPTAVPTAVPEPTAVPAAVPEPTAVPTAVPETLETEETDRAALAAFYHANGGANWTDNSNWLSEAPIGEWYGVSTDASGRVTELVLRYNRLTGSIPPVLGDLTNLRVLNFSPADGTRRLADCEDGACIDYVYGIPVGSANQLSGDIPPELGSLRKLELLGLRSNDLTGEIPPELSKLTTLKWLDLSGNQLTGKIPARLGKLTALRILDLGSNDLSGEIPPELSNHANLQWMDLAGNQLGGKIPPELSDLDNLQILDIGSNQLSGEIPAELGNLTNLATLDLGSNDLSGEIPPELGNLSNLQRLNLARNRLSGDVPPELDSLTNLQRLSLSGNQLAGCIPAGLRDVPDDDFTELGLPFCEDTPESSPKLRQIRDRGKLICASRDEVSGFDIDLCRALATAVLGDPNAIEVQPVTGQMIPSGEVDMLVGSATWTTSGDAQWGNYVQTMFYDGQGFLVDKTSDISSALDLKDAAVCVAHGSTFELNLMDFSNQNDLNIVPLTFQDTELVVTAYEHGQCDASTADRSQLAVLLGSVLSNPGAHVILTEAISEETLGPVVPRGDDQWFDVVKTVMSILIYAEAYGVDSGNVPSAVTGDARVDRLFGLVDSFGQENLGMSQTVAQDVVRAVGNYGEIYQRNLGLDGISLLRENSDNALWGDAPCTNCPKGGKIYAEPLW